MKDGGCCSKYLECSNNRKCLYTTDPAYAECYYRKNLEAGRIFYGINAGKSIVDANLKPVDKLPDPKEIQQDTSIFLYCFNRLFAVRSIIKDLSYSLSQEQTDKVEVALVDAHIPYKLQIDSITECIIDYPSEEDPAPANSRVVFEIDGEEFHLLNYNTWLIKKSIAEKIAKAFDNNFIKARVEHRGQYANIDRAEAYISGTRNVFKIDVIDKRQAPKIVEKSNTQVSMFDPVNEVPQPRPEPTKIIQLPVKGKVQDSMPVPPIESTVIAKDMYWGTYRGKLVEVYNKILADTKMAKVRIIDILEPPRQDAILEKRARYPRDPYLVDSVQVFYLDSCKGEEATHEGLCATG
jgi:hypothetical protein